MPTPIITRAEFLAAFDIWFAAWIGNLEAELADALITSAGAAADAKELAGLVADRAAWAEIVSVATLPAEGPVDAFCEVLTPSVRQHPSLYLRIYKSSLLDRLLYRREPLRTKRCPVHDGHWRGVPFEPPPCGCGLIGWLP